MARSTPRQRLEQVDDEGFTLVQRRRRRSALAPEDSAPDHRRYRVATQKEETAYGAIRRLQEAQPDLRVRLTVDGDEIYLTPRDEAAAFCLSRLSREGGVPGLNLEEVERRTRGVVMRYPLSYSLIPLQEHPRVTFARRCVKRVGHGRIEQTRQVEVVFRGAVPESLDLGLWGVFPVRKYVPEPLRCFKCQAFGHVQRHCTRESELCGVCSQRHRTSECISALKKGEHREACCPNCGDRHHAWARHCPERARRLPPAARKGAGREQRERQSSPEPESQPANPPPASPSPAPATPGRKRKRRGKRRKKTPLSPPRPREDVLSSADAAVQTEAPRTPPRPREDVLSSADAAVQTKAPRTKNKRTNTEQTDVFVRPAAGTGYANDEGEYAVFHYKFLYELLYRCTAYTAHGMASEQVFVRPDRIFLNKLHLEGDGIKFLSLPEFDELKDTDPYKREDIFCHYPGTPVNFTD